MSFTSKSLADKENNTMILLEEQRASVEKSANQGKMNAQITLGELYENGTFGSQNKSQATKWFYKAARQGDKKS